MCIVFLWRAHDQSNITTNYKLILAANRDEFLYRPAKSADFWEDHPNVLAGRDMTEGVEGGTWTGITRQGRLAFLTNVRQNYEASSEDKRGRGSLISNFLTTNQQSAREYLEEIEREKHTYRPFNLVAGQICEDEFYYINSVDEKPTERIDKEFTCLSNGLLSSGWLKVEKSLEKFKEVLSSISENDSEQDTNRKLLQFLEDKERHFPDPNVTVEHPANEWLSSVFVPMLPNQYGTRTNTVILVDNADKVTVLERTKLQPEDDVSKWKSTAYSFILDRN